jgi:hypothetical protein
MTSWMTLCDYERCEEPQKPVEMRAQDAKNKAKFKEQRPYMMMINAAAELSLAA